MRIAYTADIHLGNHKRFGCASKAGINRRCQAILDVLREAIKTAVAEKAEVFFVLGDLFDSHRPSPQILTQTAKLFWEAETYDDLQVYVLKGNHETVSAALGDHGLGPLGIESATVVETPEILEWEGGAFELWAVPFQPGDAKAWLPQVLAEMESRGSGGEVGSSPAPNSTVRALALHLGIEDQDRTPPWLRGAHDSVHRDQLAGLMQKHGITWCFAGNWHDHKFLTADKIVQVGALVPTGFNNPGMEYGGLAIYDTDRDAETPLRFWALDGPRFLKCSVADAISEHLERPGCDIYVESKVLSEGLAGERAALAAALTGGELADGVVLPDGTVAAQSAREAASATRSTATMAEAINAYLGKMPVPDGVERGDVADLVRNYLGV